MMTVTRPNRPIEDQTETDETLSFRRLGAELEVLLRTRYGRYTRSGIGKLLPHLTKSDLLDPFADVLVSHEEAVANTERLIKELERLNPCPLEIVDMEKKILIFQRKVLAYLAATDGGKATP